MNFLIRNFSDFGIIGAWSVLWLAGGFLIALYAFRLPEKDQIIAGIALGLIVDTWFANLLTLFLPADPGFWGAALATLILGIVLSLGSPVRQVLKVSFPLWQVIAFLVLTYVFTMMSRGLAIYDDYAHLPVLSMMAAGDLPPHFPLDPQVPYGYHYFLMLFAAQIMRIGNMYPWNALDLARGLSFALAIVLVYLWAARMTFSKLGGFFAGMMAAFGMGTRWLFLLLPSGLIAWLGQGVELIGSGRLTGSTLTEALGRSWGIEGAGPVAYPFAFVNGIFSPGVMNHGPNGSILIVLMMLLLLTSTRWNGWKSAVVTTILLAASLLINETGMVLLIGSFILVALLEMIRRREFRLPKHLWVWLGVVLIGGLLGFLQGGALQGIAASAIDPEAASYQTVGFGFVWPPTIVSSHLGILSLIDPRQVIVALIEIGPVILVFPLLVIFGFKSLRSSRWYESAIVMSAIISLSMIIVQFTGSTGVRNTSRLYQFIGLCSFFFVPLVWMWVSKRSDGVKTFTILVGTTIMFGGVVMTGIQLFAIQQPVFSYFINDLDVQMERDYWNKLEPGALVFDPIVSRSATIFARGSNANFTWYKSKPEWEALLASPDPGGLSESGYRYAYFDQTFWDEMPVAVQEKYKDNCVKVIKEAEDWRHDFRKLLDVSDCKGVN